TQAYNAHHDDGLAPTLVDVVDRVGRARAGGGGSGGGSGSYLVPLLLVGGAGALGWVWVRRRRTQSQELREVKEAAREDLVALADDVAKLEHDVDRDPAAK